jgi:transposase InsO family protein
VFHNLGKDLTLDGLNQGWATDITYIHTDEGFLYLSLLMDLVHHSDRGCQYCSHRYVGKLRERGLAVSMTEELHCYENANAERLNGILKQEYGLGISLRSKKQALRAVDEAAFLYNIRRPHLALDFETPENRHRRVS